MARPKGKINPERGLRLKQICNELDITQAELAKKTHISEQAISGMINGKMNVTETTAKVIHESYPEYSFEWIMDYSKYKSDWDEAVDKITIANEESAMIQHGIILCAKCDGYTIVSPISKIADSFTVETGIAAIKEGYTIAKDGKSVNISVEDMNSLMNDINDYITYRLDRYIQKGR